MAIAGGSTATNNNGVSTGGGSISNSQQWAVAMLQAGGYPQTQSNVNFLEAWASQEGGMWQNSAAYNPLNTTLQTSGSTGSVNSVGVQSYSSWNSGLAATLQTLNGSSYNSITSALAQGNATEQEESGNLSGALSTWSGGGYGSLSQISNPTIQGGSSGGSSWSPSGVTAAGGVGNSTGTGSGGTGTGSGGGGTGPSGLMSNCYQYGLSKNKGSSSCLISPPGGWCFTACEAKALASGLIIFGGTVVMLVGTALLFAGARGSLGGLVGNGAQTALNTIPGGAAAQNWASKYTKKGSVSRESRSDRQQREASEYAYAQQRGQQSDDVARRRAAKQTKSHTGSRVAEAAEVAEF
jgi:hypothetical protein